MQYTPLVFVSSYVSVWQGGVFAVSSTTPIPSSLLVDRVDHHLGADVQWVPTLHDKLRATLSYPYPPEQPPV